MNPELHKKYIGVDNKLILDNLVKLIRCRSKDLHPNPTIKEVNGNDAEHGRIPFISEKNTHIHPAQVNLLPYHNTGSSKYPKLDMEYKGTDLTAPKKKRWKVL